MGRRNRCTELRHPGVLCYLLSLLKRLGKLVVQLDELLHGYDLPAPPKSKKVGQLPSLRQFQFFDPTGYPAPNRVTFLAGVNRDFPNWRRHFI
jgi:hypothetical protein